MTQTLCRRATCCSGTQGPKERGPRGKEIFLGLRKALSQAAPPPTEGLRKGWDVGTSYGWQLPLATKSSRRPQLCPASYCVILCTAYIASCYSLLLPSHQRASSWFFLRWTSDFNVFSSLMHCFVLLPWILFFCLLFLCIIWLIKLNTSFIYWSSVLISASYDK